ncbi:MAG TPA: TolC family protein, partial [Polyangiaceae bacterium]|nr:TolC family protein [Polyangiaceae bacterium]
VAPLLSLVVATFAGMGTLAGVARAETLSAEQAVSRAAQNNPSLRAALLDARSAQYAAAAERGARDPNLVASVQAEHSESITRPGLSGLATADAASRSVANSVTANAAVTYTTDIGTDLELGTRTGTNWNSTTWSGTGTLPNNLDIGPQYTAQAYLTARQPLLRGAGSDAQLAQLHQAEAGARGAESRRVDTASQTALDVLSAYWELWYADRAVQVQEQALTVAQRLVSDAKVRATTLGTGSAVDVLQFTTQAASIADALSQARADRSGRAYELGRILGMSTGDSASLDAAGDPPEWGPVPAIDQLTSAVTNDSPALAALRAQIESAQVRVRSARNADKPRLDVFATGNVGTLWDDGSNFSLTGGRPTFGVLGGIELELPLGSGRYGADAAAAQADLEAAQARYQAEVDAAKARVSSLAVNAGAAAEQVELTTQTATAASQLAEAERQRLQLGTTTSRDVVSAEQTSREAELRRLRAVVSEASSRFELEHTAGKLLDRFAASTGRSS